MYKITFEVGTMKNDKFIRTSYKEVHYVRYTLGRSIETIVRYITRRDDKDEKIIK